MGALPLGELAGPLKLMHWVPLNPVPPLPYASLAVIVTLNAVPAVGVGFDIVKPANGPAATVKLVEVPLTAPDVTFNVVDWAS